MFDSWVGGLGPLDYERRLLPWMRRLFEGIEDLGVPITHFGVDTAGILHLQARAGGDMIGLDWRIALADGRRIVGERAVQGNLDPTLVFAPTEVMTARAAEIIEAGRAARGHIFNLGHGVIPTTDPDQLTRLTEFVQAYRPTR